MGNLPPLSETLDRLEALLKEQELDRGDALKVDELAFATALPKETVQALLDRKPVPEDTLEDRVCARIAALAASYIDTTGKRAADVRREVAAAMGRSPEWARQLLAGQSMPNLPNFLALRSYFEQALNLDIDEAFFTAPADEALNRALQPIVDRLGGYDPLAAVLAELQVARIDHRAANLSARRREALAAFIRSVVVDDEAGL